jgi:MFS family permease
VTTEVRPAQAGASTRLTPAQRNAFLGSFGGWAMDGYNWTIFGLVLAPAMAVLLPSSGIADTPKNVGYYGQISAAIFLLGWGCSFIWGPIADRFGRKPAMIGSILTYAVFTGLAGLATNVWEWNAFRFLCAVGVGGEWAMAGTLVAETVPEKVRERFGGFMHSAAYVGVLLASVVYLAAGELLGWRGMFFIGLLPALFVFVIRRNTEEPEQWRKGAPTERTGSLFSPIAEILRPPYRSRTIVNLVLLVVCVIGLWAGSTYVPTAVTDLAKHAGYAKADTVHLASLGSCVVAVFTVLGCCVVPAMVKRMGRRNALALLYILMVIGTAGAYGFAYAAHNIPGFFAFLPLLGFGGASFAVFTIWLPEQYPTKVRATAFAFTTTMSRWVAAGGTFLIGFGIHRTGSLSVPLALTAVPFLVGLAVVRLAPETKGGTLPS